MKNKANNITSLIKVKQIIELDSVDGANALLESGDWILLNSYHNRQFGNNPILRLGRIRGFEQLPPDIQPLNTSKSEQCYGNESK